MPFQNDHVTMWLWDWILTFSDSRLKILEKVQYMQNEENLSTVVSTMTSLSKNLGAALSILLLQVEFTRNPLNMEEGSK